MPDKGDFQALEEDLRAVSQVEDENVLKEEIVSGKQAFMLLQNPDFNVLVAEWEECRKSLDGQISYYSDMILNGYSIPVDKISELRLVMARMSGYRQCLDDSYEATKKVADRGEEAKQLLKVKQMVDAAEKD